MNPFGRKFYDRKFEEARKRAETPERILQIAKSKGEFRVSLRYRDDWLRARCRKLKQQGLLVGGRRHGNVLIYFPSASTNAKVKCNGDGESKTIRSP